VHQPLQLIVLGIVAFVAAMLAAVTGFGGAAVLLPMLVLVFGVREAIPILTVAQLIGNGSRVWFNRRELDWKVVAWFALGGTPMAILGGMLFAHAPLAVLTRLLGVFLILIVVWRHVRRWVPLEAAPQIIRVHRSRIEFLVRSAWQYRSTHGSIFPGVRSHERRLHRD
jgi:uncharacterized membrane protein YfcA